MRRISLRQARGVALFFKQKASSFTYSESTVILGDDNFTFFHLSILLIDDKTNWLNLIKIPREKFSFRVSKALKQP